MTAQETSREAPENAPPETKSILNLFYEGGPQVTILSDLDVDKLCNLIDEGLAHSTFVTLKSLSAKDEGPDEWFYFNPHKDKILFFNVVDAKDLDLKKKKSDIVLAPANAVPNLNDRRRQ